MRRILLVLLGFGVFAGYGSAVASARWHARHHGGCDRWERDARFERFGDRFDRRDAPPPAPVAAPAPQTVVVPQAPAPAAAPAPQVFVITVPGAAPAPAQVITVPVPAQAAAPQPAAAPVAQP